MITISRESIGTVNVEDVPDIKILLLEQEGNALEQGFNIIKSSRVLKSRILQTDPDIDISEDIFAIIENCDRVVIKKTFTHITANEAKILNSWIKALERQDHYEVINVGDRYVVKKGDKLINQGVYSEFAGYITNSLKKNIVKRANANGSDIVINDTYPWVIRQMNNAIFPSCKDKIPDGSTKVRVFVMFRTRDTILKFKYDGGTIGVLGNVNLQDVIMASKAYSTTAIHNAVERIIRETVGKKDNFNERVGTFIDDDGIVIVSTVWITSDKDKDYSGTYVDVETLNDLEIEEKWSKKMISVWGLDDKENNTKASS